MSDTNLIVEVTKLGTQLSYISRDLEDLKDNSETNANAISGLAVGQAELNASVNSLREDIHRVDNKADKLQADLTAHDIRDQQSVWTKSIKWLGGINLIQLLIIVGAVCAAGWAMLNVLTMTLGKDHTANIIKDAMTHTKEVTIRNGEIK